MSKKNTITRQLAAARRVGELHSIKSLPAKGERLLGENRLVRTWIDGKLLREESALMEMCWVGYRYMSPLERTQEFSRVYYDTYIAVYAEHFPDEDVAKKRPIERDLVRNEVGVMNAFWAARAHADASGVPYDIYIDQLMRANLDKDRWTRPPRPNQLYTKLSMPRMRDLPTAEQAAERLYGDDWDAKFFAAQYVGDPVQEAAIGWLRKIVEESSDPAATLSRYLCEIHAITKERAIEVFGVELVGAALAQSDDAPVTGIANFNKRHVPACFGLPNMSPDSPCSACPVNNQCIEFSIRIKGELVRLTGSDDPRAAWKRKGNALRQKRFRDKHRGSVENAEGDPLAD